MARRDFLTEILEKKSRLKKRAKRMTHLELRLHPLVRGFRYLKQVRKADKDFPVEWFKYYPIGYVASIEGYFKLLIANLIDHGPPFSENISNFKDVKFDIDSVLAIHSKKISLGDFISHFMSFSNVEDLNKNMSAVLGTDYLNEIRNLPLPRGDRKTVQEIFPDLIPKAQEAFRLRHMFCHELATGQVFSVKKIESCIFGLAGLVIMTEDLIKQKYLPQGK